MADIVGKLSNAAFIGFNCLPGNIMTDQIKHLKSVVGDSTRIAAYGNIGFIGRDTRFDTYRDVVQDNNEHAAYV